MQNCSVESAKITAPGHSECGSGLGLGQHDDESHTNFYRNAGNRSIPGRRCKSPSITSRDVGSWIRYAHEPGRSIRGRDYDLSFAKFAIQTSWSE
jgi:hypothetical protein